MSYDLSKVVGYTSEDKPVAWNKRDLLTYAVGVGAKNTDYNIVYELDKNFSMIPTYPVVLNLKGDSQELNLFADAANGSKPLPGLPPLDPNRMVHGTQHVEILRPLPLVSGPGWKLRSRYTGVTENKSGIILLAEQTLVDGTGTAYAKLYSSSFNLGAKATGSNFKKIIAGPPEARPIPKDRKPDWTFKDQTTPEQAIVFRLSGDYNPLHIDPKIGKAAGFGGVILHGLSTYGFGARAIINTVGGGDPNSILLYGGRFTSPVKPGHALETEVWEVGRGPNGTTEITFQIKNLTSGKIAFGGGVAHVKKSEKSKL